MICTNCNTVNQDDAAFCINCLQEISRPGLWARILNLFKRPPASNASSPRGIELELTAAKEELAGLERESIGAGSGEVAEGQCHVCGSVFSLGNEHVTWERLVEIMEDGAITVIDGEELLSVCSRHCAELAPKVVEASVEPETCLVCRKQVQRDTEYVSWVRRVQQVEHHTINVLEEEEVALACSTNCAELARLGS